MILHGCALDRLKEFPDNYFHSIVTDPPYGLSFMGKKWDYDVPSVELWREVLRVLKPGGHMLAACGTRTQHRMVLNIEDAGFEIRDVITHLYGSGFPKSCSIEKQLAKKGHIDAAKKWTGWGSALKPAAEFWTLCRKPLDGTLAQNTLNWGCGGINVDAGRIASGESLVRPLGKPLNGGAFGSDRSDRDSLGLGGSTNGRFPANLILDEEAAALLDEQSGVCKSGKPGIKRKGNDGAAYGTESRAPGTQMSGFGDSGGASRFFYTAKSSKSERNKGCDKTLTWEGQDQNLQELTAELSQLLRDTSADTTSFLDACEWNTSSSGKSETAQSQKVFKFTISTVSNLITELKTSNCSPLLSTKESILAAIRMIEENGLSLAESAAIISQSKPRTTSAKTGSARGASLALFGTLQKIRDCAKLGNVHSTVKPIKLMQYLIKLVTPPGGIVLDPFCGSGSTGVAAKSLGFGFVGVEREAEYVAIGEKRLEHADECG